MHPIVGQSLVFTFLACQPRHIRYVLPLLSLKYILVLLNSWNLNFGLIFSYNPTPLPSQLIIAYITHFKAGANVQPSDIEKQLALFHALIETKLKTLFELIINQ